MRDIIVSMKACIPHLTKRSKLLIRKGEIRHRALGGTGTFYNKALECFDTSGKKKTVRELRGNEELMDRAKNNLKDWAQGTIGVHTVAVHWPCEHQQDGKDRKTTGQMGLMLIAERRIGNKSAIVRPVKFSTTDEDKADIIKNYLKDVEAPVKVVRLVTEKKGGKIVPTTIDKVILQELLGNLALVEEDVPTVGIKKVYLFTSKIVQELEKAQFESSRAMCDCIFHVLKEKQKRKNKTTYQQKPAPRVSPDDLL